MGNRKYSIAMYARAYELYKNTDMSWKEVARALGFKYSGNLCKRIYELEENGIRR